MSADIEAETSSENPYASPSAVEAARPVELPLALWVRGNDIVAHRKADWPRQCVVSGAAGENAMHFPIATHYPVWILIAFFGSFVICAVLSLSLLPREFAGAGAAVAFGANLIGLFVTIAYMAKPTQITYYLSPDAFAIRRRKLRLALALNLIGGAIVVLSIAARIYFAAPLAMLGFFIGIIITAGGGRYRVQWRRILKPVKMHREYTVLRGAGKPFLATLPEWPYGAV